MDRIDIPLGVLLDQSLTKAQQQIEGLYQTIQKINATPVNVTGSAGVGGGGGRGGGGVGPSSAAASAAAASSGFATTVRPVQVPEQSVADIFGYYSAPPDPASTRAASRSSSAAKSMRDSEWSNWARISGFNAIAYGLEDLYMGGIGGMINNLPFAAQGLASTMGKDALSAMAWAGKASLAGTAAYMLYRNRESIYEGLGVQDMMSRENSILGVAQKSESQKAQKLYDNAAFYADRYGAGSAIGQSYTASAATALADMQMKAMRETNAEQIAGLRMAGTSAQKSAAERLASLSVYPGDIYSYYESQAKSTGMGDIQRQAQEAVLFENTYTDPIRNLLFNSNIETNKNRYRDKVNDLVGATAGKSANNVVNALSGNASAILALEQERSTTQNQARKAEIDQILNLSRNLSASDANSIERLRGEASNPFARLDGNLNSITQILQNAGAGGDFLQMITNAIGKDMQSQQKGATTGFQDDLAQNYGYYKNNIGAALGSIELNSPYKGTRNAQAANLRRSIYSDLVAKGAMPREAMTETANLFQSGMNAYRQMVGNAQGNPMMFLNSLNEEQQMAFGMFQQNRLQIQMHQSILRRAALQRSRSGLRGMR